MRVAWTTPFNSVPVIATLRPFRRSPQSPFLKSVEPSAMTVKPRAVNVTAGHLPDRLLTVPSKSTLVPVGGGAGAGAGAGVGAGAGDGLGVGAGAGAGVGVGVGAGAGGAGAVAGVPSWVTV